MSTTIGKFLNEFSHNIVNIKLTELIANQQRLGHKNVEESLIVQLQCNNRT